MPAEIRMGGRLLSVWAGAILVVALALASCGGSDPATGEGADGAPPVPTLASTVHSAIGTFNSVDRAAGTINITHEAVPSAQWPAMTMNFHIAASTAVGDLAPGQHIAFEFTTDNGGTVTKVTPAP
jgi:Cu(I)/Ag(I) efflux system membrane fusion protein